MWKKQHTKCVRDLYVCGGGVEKKLGWSVQITEVNAAHLCTCARTLISGTHDWLLFTRTRPSLQHLAAEIKVPSVENSELKSSPFKAWSKSVYSHKCYDYYQGFLSDLFRHFRSIHLHFFQNLSRVFPVLAVANSGSCGGPKKNKKNKSPCWFQVPVLSARGI